MTWLKFIRYGAWGAVGLLVFLSAAILLGWAISERERAGTQSVGPASFGGAFQLVDHRGRSVSEADFKGRPMLVFFGFTYCPEVCPTTLMEIGNRLARLGAEGERLQVLFITVDPERDTPAQLALYLQSFDPRIVGLSGSQAQVDAALAAYKAYAKKVPSAGGYTMDHTASLYLMDAQGRFRTMIDYHEDEAAALAKIRLLLR